jgi:alkylation response protein AidB-like acyl-CoA dehydrogenase
MSTATLAENLDELLRAYDPATGPDPAFRGKQFDLGLAWVHFPPGEGGLGLDHSDQAQINRALNAAGITEFPWRAGVGIPLVAPTLAVCGTAEQRARYLRPIFTGDEGWCQLFSEPGAGSDLASLATRARRQDHGWVINGQKVWTSLGHVADWGILCARTDPDAPKHLGLTYFIVDMRAPGVETRPLRQITGEAEYDEVFLTDVVLADTMRVGEIGAGWGVTLATLANERAAFASDLPGRGEGPVCHLLDAWREHGALHTSSEDDVLKLAVQAEALRHSQAEANAAAQVGTPSATWSFLKLANSELEQRIVDLALTLRGPDGLAYGDYTMSVPDEMTSLDHGSLHRGYLFARALTIAGGTSEIQRTIIADRVLGLPREPNADKTTPWRDLPRN